MQTQRPTAQMLQRAPRLQRIVSRQKIENGGAGDAGRRSAAHLDQTALRIELVQAAGGDWLAAVGDPIQYQRVAQLVEQPQFEMAQNDIQQFTAGELLQ